MPSLPLHNTTKPFKQRPALERRKNDKNKEELIKLNEKFIFVTIDKYLLYTSDTLISYIYLYIILNIINDFIKDATGVFKWIQPVFFCQKFSFFASAEIITHKTCQTSRAFSLQYIPTQQRVMKSIWTVKKSQKTRTWSVLFLTFRWGWRCRRCR